MSEATAEENKSIINPKYRDKYKTPDWLGQIIAENCSATHTVEIPEKKDEKGKVVQKASTKEVVDGIDFEKLSALAAENGIDASAYAELNAGQQRMNVGNRLRSLTLKRHGLTVNGEWVKADADWLKEKNAPEAPTHNKDGSAIAKAAPKVDKKEAAAARVEGKPAAMKNGKK